MNLAEGTLGNQYKITEIRTDDEELESFLLTLGCYPGQTIGLISQVSGSFVVSIRDGRYNIDKDLAAAILISE